VSDANTAVTPPAEVEVNIEDIMRRIRQEIMARRASQMREDDGLPLVAVTGERFPVEFYEHLYQARLALEEGTIPVFVSKSTVPLIGGLIDGIRAKFHELVAYYVNQSAARQMAATTHLLSALDLAARTLEEDAPEPGDGR
jgi:hypothetical protein